MFAFRRFSFRPPKFDRCVESLKEQFIQQTAVRNLGGVSGTSGELFSSTQCPQREGNRRSSMSLILSRALSDDRGVENDDFRPKDGESSPPAAGLKEGRTQAEKKLWNLQNKEDKEKYSSLRAPEDQLYDRGSRRLTTENDDIVSEINIGSVKIKLDDITGVELESGEQIEGSEQIIEYLKRENFAAPFLDEDRILSIKLPSGEVIEDRERIREYLERKEFAAPFLGSHNEESENELNEDHILSIKLPSGEVIEDRERIKEYLEREEFAAPILGSHNEDHILSLKLPSGEVMEIRARSRESLEREDVAAPFVGSVDELGLNEDDIASLELPSGEVIEDRERIREYLEREEFAAPFTGSDDDLDEVESDEVELDDIASLELTSGEVIEDRERIREYLEREKFAAPFIGRDDELDNDDVAGPQPSSGEDLHALLDADEIKSLNLSEIHLGNGVVIEDPEDMEEYLEGLLEGPEAEKQAKKFEKMSEESKESFDVKSFIPYDLRCGSDDIRECDFGDVGKLYNISGVTERQYLPEGCDGLRKEFEATEVRRLMIRENFLRLIHLDLVPEGEVAKKPILLQGPLGVGKSILLSQVVHWARASGWLVMYLPNAPYLLSNSSYCKNEATGMWDTPDTVYHLLQDFQKAHGELLDELVPVSGTSTLGALVEDALQLAAPGQTKPPPADEVVDACLKVIEEVEKVTKVPTLICIDSYNALFGGSDFYEPMENHRRQIPASELRLVAKLRDMSSVMANGTRVAATSMSARVPEKIPLLNVPEEARRHVRTFDYGEAASYLAHIRLALGVVAHLDEDHVLQLHFLSGGRPKQLRLLSSEL